jgi:DNA-binding XRE family transcriptional regulator
VILLSAVVEALGRHGVRRIDEKDHALALGVLAHDLDPVGLEESDTVPDPRYVQDPLPQGVGIPAREEPLALLTVLEEAGPGRKDAAAVDPVLDDRPESPVHDGAACSPELAPHVLLGQVEPHYPLPELLATAVQDRSPHGSDLLIGRNLTRLREDRLLTQAELAERAGIALSSFVRVENDQVDPRFTTICKLARALDVDHRELTKSEDGRRRDKAGWISLTSKRVPR